MKHDDGMQLFFFCSNFNFRLSSYTLCAELLKIGTNKHTPIQMYSGYKLQNHIENENVFGSLFLYEEQYSRHKSHMMHCKKSWARSHCVYLLNLYDN